MKFLQVAEIPSWFILQINLISKIRFIIKSLGIGELDSISLLFIGIDYFF